MKDFHHVITTTVDGKPLGTLEWSGNAATREITLSAETPSVAIAAKTVVVWKVDFKKQKLEIDLSQVMGAVSGTCLLGCMIGAGAGMANCIRKAKNEDEV